MACNPRCQQMSVEYLIGAESTHAADTNDLQSEETAIPEADEWVVAASSHNAARRHRKKQLKRQLRAQSSGASYNPATAQLDTQSVAQEGELNDRDTIRHTEDSAERSNSSDCDPDESSSQSEDEEHGSIGTSIAESRRISDATICISTADFAMQNVILQMGLRLVSPDGRQIRRISKWVLRCSACFKVTKVRAASHYVCLQHPRSDTENNAGSCCMWCKLKTSGPASHIRVCAMSQ